jgi:Arc/MetJ-type ribon-helix-helix transcriptional regulator
MRQIISISLPKPMVDLVDKEIKEKLYTSKSEFFRSLIRQWSDQKAVDEVLESKKQMEKGEKYLLKSFKDLRNM